MQLEKKERLQRALGEATNALQFQQREAQGQKRRRDGWRNGLVDIIKMYSRTILFTYTERGDQARSLHFIALPAFEG